MGLFRSRRLFEPAGDGNYKVRLPLEARQWVSSLADEMERLVDIDDEDTKRLFPTAYIDDPELDEGYQVLAREQLIDDRRAAIQLVRDSAERSTLTGEELGAWMNVVNNLRLVLGTKLDVSEDEHEIDLEGPNVEALLLSRGLSELLAEIVDGLTTDLPEPEDS
jgi:hypothetical protein